MPEPVTTIDSRFSDPAAVATPWEQTLRVLETAELSWLSTVRADGRPHVTPLVAVWFEGAVYFSTGVALPPCPGRRPLAANKLAELLVRHS